MTKFPVAPARLVPTCLLVTGLFSGNPFAETYWEYSNRVGASQNAHLERYKQALKRLPEGSKRDSAIAKLVFATLCDSISNCNAGSPAHVSNGRIDTLVLRLAREEYAYWWFPEEIGDLTGLKSLTVRGDSDSTVPARWGRLENLEYLDLSGLKLSALPPGFGNLKKLRTLILSDNRLVSIPPAIFKLRNLEVLDLSGNRISEVGPGVGNLARLTRLDLAGNRLRFLAPEIAKLPHLDSLDLTGDFLVKEDLDPALVAWLGKRGHDWKIAVEDRDLTGFIRDLGKHLLRKESVFNVEASAPFANYSPPWSDTLEFIRITANTVRGMLAKADSQALSAAIGKIARGDSDRIMPREMVRGLLSTYAFCRKYPEVLDIVRYEIGRLVSKYKQLNESGSGEWSSELVFPQYFQGLNRRLAEYDYANRNYLLFWGGRQRDKSIEEMARLLERIRQVCFPGLPIDTVSLEKRPEPQPLRTFYFSDRTFGDTAYADMRASFVHKEEIILPSLRDVYPRDCRSGGGWDVFQWHLVKGPHLRENLLALRSPYFDTALAYFALSGDSNRQYQWEETVLEPELYVKWDNCEGYDASYNLQTHLLFANPGTKDRNRIFVAVPRKDYAQGRNGPAGFFQSKQLKKSSKEGQVDGASPIINMDIIPQHCRWVTKRYGTPPACPKLKSMWVEDLYLFTGWENRHNFDPKAGRYAPDNSLLAQSTLYALYASGETAALNVDSSYWFGWVDGGGDLFGAYTLPPRFADLNGDGRSDLFFETRKGTIFFNQREDGTFGRQPSLPSGTD